MLESIVIALFPVAFLSVVMGTGEVFKRRQIDVGGRPPINPTLFLSSKYLIVVVWLATALQGFGVPLPLGAMRALTGPAILCWVAGFVLLFLGRFGLGSSFRIGSPREATALKVDGLFRVSRNPMYVGVYLTLLGATLYTANPIILVLSLYICIVHHMIVLAEEGFLRTVFGDDYTTYCGRVRRYL